MNESPTISNTGSARAEDAGQPGTESLNGNGFYRFKIGDFQATVISDGYGPQIRCYRPLQTEHVSGPHFGASMSRT